MARALLLIDIRREPGTEDRRSCQPRGSDEGGGGDAEGQRRLCDRVAEERDADDRGAGQADRQHPGDRDRLGDRERLCLVWSARRRIT
jgi:hypothetical protein